MAPRGLRSFGRDDRARGHWTRAQVSADVVVMAQSVAPPAGCDRGTENTCGSNGQGWPMIGPRFAWPVRAMGDLNIRASSTQLQHDALSLPFWEDRWQQAQIYGRNLEIPVRLKMLFCHDVSPQRIRGQLNAAYRCTAPS